MKMNDTQLAASVVIACYNAEATISETLESVLAQSIGNIEVLVIDDGSTDRSRACVTTLAERDPRVRLISQANAGPSRARNAGISAARAEFVAFLDSDDLWTEDHLARNLQNLRDDRGLGVSFSPVRFMDAQGCDTGGGSRTWLQDITPRDVLDCNPTATCSALVFRKTVVETAGGMREDISFAEDQEWLFRILMTGWAIRCTGAATVRYRLSPGGLSSRVEKMHQGWKTFIALAEDRWPDSVRPHRANAEARMHLYWARRTLRDGGSAKDILAHIRQSIACAPAIIAQQPLALAALFSGALAPRLTNRLIDALRTPRHA